MAEENKISSIFLRNVLRRRRSIKVSVLDSTGNVILKIHRPLYLLNSRIIVYDHNDNYIGEAVQEWHLWRRRYNLFVKKSNAICQFAKIDAGFLSWDFLATDEEGCPLAAVNKNFSNFAQEIFTDANNYAIHFNIPGNSNRFSTLDERSILLAAAISIDTDYFTRSSRLLPLPLPYYGGAAAESGVAGAGVASVGAEAAAAAAAGGLGAAAMGRRQTGDPGTSLDDVDGGETYQREAEPDESVNGGDEAFADESSWFDDVMDAVKDYTEDQ
jgi:uncharacterized protein YxjI